MTESQRKWLRSLLDKGVIFEYYNTTYETWTDKPTRGNQIRFNSFEKFRIPAQPITDIPDWRELCREMKNKGVKFKFLWGSMWENADVDINFTKERDRYQIPEQPLPEWKEEPHPVQYLDALQDRPEIHTKAVPEKSFKMGRKEEMTEETKDAVDRMIESAESEVKTWPQNVKNATKIVQPEKTQYAEETMFTNLQPVDQEHMHQIEELYKIPHRDLQIQWHRDKIHSLETGEPMREWEYKRNGGWWSFAPEIWHEDHEYRRKPRLVKYWHCVVEYGYNEEVGIEKVVLWSTYSKDELESEIQHIKDNNPTAKFTPIIEATSELED